MKSIFEQHGGTYTMQGDYRLPKLLPPTEEEHPIGVWGQRRLRYLKQHHKILYYNLLTSGKIHSHLADTEEQAQELFYRLVKEYAEKEGVTEQLKAENAMLWVRKMNNIRNRAAEMVNNEVIYRQL
ncbi:MAG: TnpV protein [Lachnospiraceae bacterium]